MNKKIDDKLHTLDPRFRSQIEDLFHKMNQSISILYEAATHDEKTGLYNNKFFENVLDMEIEKAQRQRQKLCLLIIDIDFFKRINDKYGHIKADNLLKRLAQLLKKQLRKSDVIARFGGEEFIILLPETTCNKAKKLTARLRNAIKSDDVFKKFRVTVSGGLTCFKEKDNKRKFKERADRALYKAKNSGRDKFVFI